MVNVGFQVSAVAIVVVCLGALNSFVCSHHIQVVPLVDPAYGNDEVEVTCSMDESDASLYDEVNGIVLYHKAERGASVCQAARGTIVPRPGYNCQGEILSGSDLWKSRITVYPMKEVPGEVFECRFSVVARNGSFLDLKADGSSTSALHLDIRIKNDPAQVNGRAPNMMEFSCQIEGDNFHHIGSLQQIRLEIDSGGWWPLVVNMSVDGNISSSDLSLEVEADGHMDSTGIKGSFLTVRKYNIEHPGVYTCVVTTTNLRGQEVKLPRAGLIIVDNTALTSEVLTMGFNIARQRLATLRSKLDDSLKGHQDIMDGQMELFDQRKHEYDVGVADLKRRLDQNAKKLALKRLRDNTIVVFHVTQGDEDFVNLEGRPIIYTRVDTNLGGGYDPQTGVFTAPNDGLYNFYYSVFVSKEAYIYVDLKQSGDRVLKTIVGGAPGSWRQFADGGTVTKLHRGDKVYLSVGLSGGKFVKNKEAFCDKDGYRNRFEGYLLNLVST